MVGRMPQDSLDDGTGFDWVVACTAPLVSPVGDVDELDADVFACLDRTGERDQSPFVELAVAEGDE